MIRTVLSFAVIVTVLTSVLPCAAAEACDFSTVRTLVVQHNGRLKPFDTYAREQLRFIYRRERYRGQDPVETALAIAFEKRHWGDRALLVVPYVPLLEALGYTKEKEHLSSDEFARHLPALRALAEGQGTPHGGSRRLAQAANELFQRANALRTMAEFESSVPIVPTLSDDPEAEWTALAQVSGHPDAKMAAIREAFPSLGQAFLDENASAFAEESERLTTQLRALAPDTYLKAGRVALECRYNALKPFRAALVLYIITLLVAMAGLWAKHRGMSVALFIFLALSALVHTGGLVVRTIIAGRAPLTNMYESLVLMSWGIAVLGLIFEAKYRLRFAALVASLLGAVTLVVAQHLTIEIRPAIAVLRSSWLTYHVLTVMLGYSAFVVALGGGHVVLARHALGYQQERFSRLDDLIYRLVQVGVLFLAAGIITGSVWASYSWGRAWGWDPKETWSLITLLGYLAVLHARHQKWLESFGMGVASVLCFLMVVMTYYGVNYILRGLHSYAGDEVQRIPFWLVAFVVCEVLYVAAAAFMAALHRGRDNSI